MTEVPRQTIRPNPRFCSVTRRGSSGSVVEGGDGEIEGSKRRLNV
jgi:hypothetical protein